MKVHTRLMQQSDVEKIASIYNLIIEERIATFNVELIDAKSVKSWNDEGIVLVAEFENEVVGFVRSYAYSSRSCYHGISEFSIYIQKSARRYGVGDILMERFLELLEKEGKWKVLSRVFPENTPSLNLLRKHGFREAGKLLRHASLDGVWRDVVIVERLLGPAEEDA